MFMGTLFCDWLGSVCDDCMDIDKGNSPFEMDADPNFNMQTQWLFFECRRTCSCLRLSLL